MKRYSSVLFAVIMFGSLSFNADILRAENLFTFERSAGSTAKVDIYAENKASKPVSRYLYGKFTEHITTNIYGGMWAQILNNPGFEGWKYFLGWDRGNVGRRYEQYMELIKKNTAGKGSSGQDTDSLWLSRDIAPWWIAYGNGDVIYKLDTDSFNSELSQKITVKSLKSRYAGVRQAVYLPLHREKDYEFSFYARSAGSVKLTVAIGKVSDENDVLAERSVNIAGRKWKRYSLKFRVNEAVKKGTLLTFDMGLSKPGTVWLDETALFPQDNVKGFDVDVIKLTRESRPSIIRWPGGNFASGYHWKDGIGPIDRRKTTMNVPWDMIEYNYVGIDEFMDFCRAVGTEPLILVNAGDGTPEEAAQWVEYANGSVNTKYGALRAKNGHPEPYNIVYWEIGNELYGSWQIGYTTAEGYAVRYRNFYDAMTAVDPDIKLIANGRDRRAWNGPIIRQDADILRSLSIHTLIGGGTSKYEDVTKVFKSLMAYTYYYPELINGLGSQMAEKVKKPEFAITELNVFTNTLDLPNNKNLSEALFYSGILNVGIRSGGLIGMITHSELVNSKRREIVYPNAGYYARRLYSGLSGSVPARINVSSPMYRSSGRYSPAMDVPYLDAIDMVDEKSGKLDLILTNRYPEKALDVRIELHDFNPGENVNVQTLTGESFMSYNTWNNPDEVTLKKSVLRIDGKELNYTVPAHSIVSLTFSRK
ncbi:MAG: hypothetical protein GXP33_02825 [Spirochaetes bacterium]|nr:hypothetical protein [Spirochaetota bacterium]